jgi:hypothetical protein
MASLAGRRSCPKLIPHANAALWQPIQLKGQCHQHIELRRGYEGPEGHFVIEV